MSKRKVIFMLLLGYRLQIFYRCHHVTKYLKWQWILPFYIYFSSITTKFITWWVSYKKQELLTLHKHLGSPPVFWLFSLDCPFLIAPSVFSNIYWHRCLINIFFILTCILRDTYTLLTNGKAGMANNCLNMCVWSTLQSMSTFRN